MRFDAADGQTRKWTLVLGSFLGPNLEPSKACLVAETKPEAESFGRRPLILNHLRLFSGLVQSLHSRDDTVSRSLLGMSANQERSRIWVACISEFSTSLSAY